MAPNNLSLAETRRVFLKTAAAGTSLVAFNEARNALPNKIADEFSSPIPRKPANTPGQIQSTPGDTPGAKRDHMLDMLRAPLKDRSGNAILSVGTGGGSTLSFDAVIDALNERALLNAQLRSIGLRLTEALRGDPVISADDRLRILKEALPFQEIHGSDTQRIDLSTQLRLIGGVSIGSLMSAVHALTASVVGSSRELSEVSRFVGFSSLSLGAGLKALLSGLLEIKEWYGSPGFSEASGRRVSRDEWLHTMARTILKTDPISPETREIALGIQEFIRAHELSWGRLIRSVEAALSAVDVNLDLGLDEPVPVEVSDGRLDELQATLDRVSQEQGPREKEARAQAISEQILTCVGQLNTGDAHEERLYYAILAAQPDSADGLALHKSALVTALTEFRNNTGITTPHSLVAVDKLDTILDGIIKAVVAYREASEKASES